MKTAVELLKTEGRGLKVKIKHYFNVFNVEAASCSLWDGTKH